MQRSKIPLSFDRQTYRCEQFIRGYNYSFFHIFCQKYTADAFQHYVYFQANIDQGKVSAPVDLPEILSLGFAQVNGFYLFANDINLKNISSHVGSVYAYKINIEQPAAELVQVLDARYFQAAEPFSISHFEVMLNGDASYQRFLAAGAHLNPAQPALLLFIQFPRFRQSITRSPPRGFPLEEGGRCPRS